MADNSVGHLKVSGAEGESQVTGFKNQIKINRWGFGGSAGSTVNQTGGSSAPGRPNMGPVWVVADMDKGTSTMLNFLFEGKHETTAELAVQRIGTQSNKLVQLTLEEAYVTSWSVRHEQVGMMPQVEIVLSYAELKYEYFTQAKDGTTTSTGQHQFKVAENAFS
jgi:type VI protein secretion system component Hcp